MTPAPAYGPTPVPWIEDVAAYPLSRPTASVLLDGNEGDAPGLAIEERLSATDRDALRRYPDRRPLESRLAELVGVDPSQVLVTAGSSEAMERVCRTFLGPGRQIIVPSPTFGMLRTYARISGAEVLEVPWSSGSFPTEAVLQAAGPRTAVVAIVSPNNPTGAVVEEADLVRIARALPNNLILVDLAYIEFSDHDLTPAAIRLPNAVTLRTMSKAWGMAGLRIGYAVGNPRIVSWLRAAGGPYSVSAPSLALASARLSAGGVASFVAQVRRERSRLARTLEELGAEPLPSQANFVFCRFESAAWVEGALASLGIAVRGFHELGGLRITCPGDEESYQRLADALETVLRPGALLFDLDGVIADDSGSYRRAIVETCASYGVVLDPAELSEAKRRPGSTNDWLLTHELLARREVEVPFDGVRQRFEEIYQGSGDRPGLREAEHLTIGTDDLRELADELPLAVVTGRPRADAQRFLRQAGVEHLFRAVVAMEDALGKPDPAPVQKALGLLGVRHAWLIGDTPDDMIAARACGVLPIGVVAPGDDPGKSREALTGAGAAQVLASLADVRSML